MTNPQRDLRVAERLLCPTCRGTGQYFDESHPDCISHTCRDCQGTGGPLREPCQCIDDDNQAFYERYPKHAHWPCLKRGWLPNVTYDTLKAAIRAKGWNIQIHSHADWTGDFVHIERTYGSRLAYVEANDCLLGLEAILVALDRAVEKE